MAKTLTKVVAGLGIVAGLGVAIAPLATYAAQDVLISVTVNEEDNTGDCTGASCTGGGNNGLGYTITIEDGDGVKFNLSNNTLDAGSNDNEGATSGGFAPIGAATTALPTTWTGNVYGLKFSAGASSTYTGNYTGTLAETNAISEKYFPVAAEVGTLITATPGEVEVSVATGEHHDSTIANGVYTNTISIAFAANS